MRGFNRQLRPGRGRVFAQAGVALFVATVSTRLTAQSPDVAAAPATASSASEQPATAAATRPPAVVATAVSAAPATHEEETAMLRWGGVVVWFHATNAGTVLVFASAGYRDPFAHPVVLTADEVDRWGALAGQLAVTTGNPPSADTAGIALAAGNLVLAPALGGPTAALTVRFGATRSDALVTTLFPDLAPVAAASLHDAAREARRLHATALAAAAAAAIPAPASPTAVAVATPSLASAPAAARSSSPAATPASTAPVSSTPHPRPTSQPRRPAPAAAPPPVHPSADSAAANLVAASVKTSTPALLSRVSVTAAAPSAPATPTTPAPKSPEPAHSTHVAPASATATSGHPAKTPASATPVSATQGVSDATVNNLVRQWQPELTYCYTEFGTRTHPDLTGQATVRVVLSADGAVGHAAIEHHIWSGEGGAAVESCIRSRVAAWRFPPAAAGSAHVFKVEFAP